MEVEHESAFWIRERRTSALERTGTEVSPLFFLCAAEPGQVQANDLAVSRLAYAALRILLQRLLYVSD